MEEEYIIRYHGSEFPASEYQCAIFRCIEKGTGNLVINAAAGASKTTTIVNATYYIPERKKILFIAFNKEIVENLRNEVTHPKAHVTTFHSLGFSMLKERNIITDETVVNEYKYTAYLNANIGELMCDKKMRKSGVQWKTYLNNIKKLTDFARFYLAFTPHQISKVAAIYGITPVSDEYLVVNKMLIWGKERLDSIDYTDMIWLPNVLNLTTKAYQADWIFIDEAQDTSVTEQAMVEKCFRRGTRFCTVGDEHQQINVWAGSSEDAIVKFKEKPNTVECTLPVSYRCPRKIVELASNYSDNIMPSPSAMEGEINDEVGLFSPSGGDMVLCRNTSPLVDLQMKYMSCGKKSYIRGAEDIKSALYRYIDGFDCEYVDKSCVTLDGLYPCLYRCVLTEYEKVKMNYGLNEEEASKHPNVTRLLEVIDSINILSDNLLTVNELKERIEKVFKDDETDAVQLCTVHKAKGLEADNVYILKPSLMPSTYATKEWEIKSERNLMYVAFTRAKRTLNFMRESEYEKRKYIANVSIVRKLDEYRAKINFSESLGNNEDALRNVMAKTQTVYVNNGDKDPVQRKIGAAKMRNLFTKK